MAQEANSDNLGKSFRFSTQSLYVECNYNCLNEAILMSTHNKQFQISHGKRAIGVRVIDVRLYLL